MPLGLVQYLLRSTMPWLGSAYFAPPVIKIVLPSGKLVAEVVKT